MSSRAATAGAFVLLTPIVVRPIRLLSHRRATLRPTRHVPLAERRPRVLLIGGSINQTSMLHQVGNAISNADCVYSPYYTDGYLEVLNRLGLLNFSVAGHGGRFRRNTSAYLRDHRLTVDDGGRLDDYDLVVTGSDLVIQRNIKHKPIVLGYCLLQSYALGLLIAALIQWLDSAGQITA